MAEIEGLDDLRRQLEEALAAADVLKGELEALRFNPDDPRDVERAIAEMQKIVDGRFYPYRNNPLIQPLAEETKEALRKGILEQVRRAKNN